MNDQESHRIRNGFDKRVRDAFEAEQGKPLVRAAKRPPLAAGRGHYVRHYSWSIMDFATRCFFLGQQIDEANAALIENARHYLDNPKDINDRDSFHWHAEMLCRLIELYGSKGSATLGLLKAEAEELMMECLWLYASGHMRPNETDATVRQVWNIHTSDNHHSMDNVAKWHYAQLAKDHPAFCDRKYPDGLPPAEKFAAWNEHVKLYCLEHARKGLFIELASDNYNVVGTKAFYNYFDFAQDLVLKRRMGYLLELHWAMWAQEQIGGVRGGPRTRIYQTGDDRLGNSDMRALAWFYFGIGNPVRPVSPLLPALTSAWRPSLAVIDLALDIEGRGQYEVRHRPLGLSWKNPDNPTARRSEFDLDGGSLLCYSWCTPGFIMGTPMVEARPREDWTAMNAQNRWHGVIFAGHPNARIVPQVKADTERATYNAQWSVQNKGTLICQKLKTCEMGKEMRIWFSEPGLANRRDENGWIFVEAPEAYAAARVVSGGTQWEPNPTVAGPEFIAPNGYLSDDTPGAVTQLPADKNVTFAGAWLRCNDEWSPVILEVAPKGGFADYEAFRKAVAALPLSFRASILTYQGLSGDTFTLYADQTKNPEIDGKPVDYAPTKVLESPFLQSDRNSAVVTIKKGDRAVVLDFNEN